MATQVSLVRVCADVYGCIDAMRLVVLYAVAPKKMIPRWRVVAVFELNLQLPTRRISTLPNCHSFAACQPADHRLSASDRRASMVGVLRNHRIPVCSGTAYLGLMQPARVFQLAAVPRKTPPYHSLDRGSLDGV